MEKKRQNTHTHTQHKPKMEYETKRKNFGFINNLCKFEVVLKSRAIRKDRVVWKQAKEKNVKK